ncbi:MAG TPA: hypothetical protein VEF72_29400 [Mycobacterium sp.]|nr:hypothetical protein [Mycobacterium sp.]
MRNPSYPAQIVCSVRDPALSWRRYGVQAQLAAGATDLILLPGKHFLQEDYPAEIAQAVLQPAQPTSGR